MPGILTLRRDLLEAAFKPHVDPIAITAAQIVANDGLKVCSFPAPTSERFKVHYYRNPLQHVFCSGGFGDSPYLRETLERVVREARIIQPEQTASS